MYCEIINILEIRQAIKGFFNPAKTISAVRLNFRKVFDYLKKLKNLASDFYSEKEIAAGNEIFVIGLLEDIKNVYFPVFHDKENQKNLKKNDIRS